MSRKTNETIIPKTSGDRVQIVKDFLDLHYEIKINIFDPTKSVIVAVDSKRYKSEPTLDDISLHMESEGVRGCDTILKKIIRSSNQVTTYNPITEYLESLVGKWKGESHIDRLCTYITARDFGDQNEVFYQERFKYIFKKWLVASVACSLGIKPNDTILGIMSAKGGLGKTSFVEYITPGPLKRYFANSDKQERYFDINKAFSQNFIINFEELEGIKKSTNETLKKTLSCKTLSINNNVDVPRIANAVFTSNKVKEKGGFLLHGMNDRRYAIVEVDKINYKEYINNVDVDQLWAEAYNLLQSASFDYVWYETDYDNFINFNLRYQVETQAEKLIKEYYRIPEPDEISEHKQPIEILQDLRRARKLSSGMTNVSDVTLGMALRALGYEHKMKKVSMQPRYGYMVIQLYE